MTHRTHLWLLCFAISSLACPSTEDPICPPTDDLAAGEVSATVNGVPWTAPDGAWFWAGTNLQAVTGTHDGWRLSMLGQRTTADETVRDAVSAATFPIEIPLTSGAEGGWAILYPESGDSFASERAAGGTWYITAVDGDELHGCFGVELSDGAHIMTMEDAVVRLLQTVQ